MRQTFIYNNEGVEETVEREKWGWIAIYKNGSFLRQFDEATGIFHKFNEINIPELDCFIMQNLDDPTDVSKRYEIHFIDGMKPIHYYKRGRLEVGGENEVGYTLYCFGYEQKLNCKTVKNIMTIYPNGTVAIRTTD